MTTSKSEWVEWTPFNNKQGVVYDARVIERRGDDIQISPACGSGPIWVPADETRARDKAVRR